MKPQVQAANQCVCEGKERNDPALKTIFWWLISREKKDNRIYQRISWKKSQQFKPLHVSEKTIIHIINWKSAKYKWAKLHRFETGYILLVKNNAGSYEPARINIAHTRIYNPACFEGNIPCAHVGLRVTNLFCSLVAVHPRLIAPE